MSIEFTNEQVYMLYDLEKWWHSRDKQVFEISGAAGTGKTTCIKYFIEKIGLKMKQVLFVSYMGKACARMLQEGLPAKTIHSTIYNTVKVKKRDKNGTVVYGPTGHPKYTYEFILKDSLPPHVKLIVADEASMIPADIAEDLLSFNMPIVTLGDLNQLPPVFGKSIFLQSPNVHLKQVMRQKEGDPIIYLANRVLNDQPLKPGIYGKSAVLRKEDLNEGVFRSADMILTGTNRLRYNVNNYIRQNIRRVGKIDRPHVREKIICRKNNWKMKTHDGYYLMNGITGFVDKIYTGSCDGKTMMIDFRPDFGDGIFRKVTFDFKHLNEVPGQETDGVSFIGGKAINIIEYAYAITVHSSQGSSFENVLYIHEDFVGGEKKKKLMYTAITRARNSIVIIV